MYRYFSYLQNFKQISTTESSDTIVECTSWVFFPSQWLTTPLYAPNFNPLSNWIMHQNLPPSIPLGRSTQNNFSQSPQCHNLYFYFNTIYITSNKSFTLTFTKSMVKPNLSRSKILTVDLSITGNLATFTTNFFPWIHTKQTAPNSIIPLLQSISWPTGCPPRSKRCVPAIGANSM